MDTANITDQTLLRMPQVRAITGMCRSTIYHRKSEGLFVSQVQIGPRAVGFPAGEVLAINAARIAGKSDDEIRALVKRLMAAREAGGV